ncbi:tyrosine-type recombinase/integrase, partial [Laribacter hongkongensis]|uniref:tyrosine-type recombinase/integrase n=1 Tax=Laribacter hongkongensis TaxID=168471 RepID=UPI001EFD0FA0
EIEKQIAFGTFDYAKYFPQSKRAKLFCRVQNGVTVGQLLVDYLRLAERTLKASTVNDYRKSINGDLTEAFGRYRIADLTPAIIRDWVMTKEVTVKRIRNILIPLRNVLEQALVDGLIEKNPLDQVIINKLVSRDTAKTGYEVDPFNDAEISAILSECEGEARNLIQFAFYSGLRTNELIALEWGDVDFVGGTVRVQRGQVLKKVDTPKTNAGVRDVMLLEPARLALVDQKKFTFMGGARIFHNPRTGKPWETDAQIRKTLWTHILKRAGVRYRNPYQTRHTYASMLLSRGENPWWLATQMGHVNIEMIMRHYGKWIPDSSKTGYQLVNQWELPTPKSA